MSSFDAILQKLGIQYSDLTDDEFSTLQSWKESLQTNTLTVEKIQSYITDMRDAVQREITKTDHNTKQDIFLKARLRNLLILEGLMVSPEKAQKAIDARLQSFAKNKSKTVL